MSRPSRLQRQILSLYRELLRAGRGKPGAEARVRAEFRLYAGLPRSDVLRIEYLYRRGQRQLQLLRSGHAKAMGAFVRPRALTEDPGSAGLGDGDGTGDPACGTVTGGRAQGNKGRVDHLGTWEATADGGKMENPPGAAGCSAEV